MPGKEAMSLADEARTLRDRVAARLAELEPLVREYEELQRLAAEMGITAADVATGAGADEHHQEPVAAEPVTQAGTEAPRRRPGRSRRNRASVAAERDARVLEAVRANPGATVAEIAAAVGLETTALYRTVRDLASAGAVIQRGRGLFPAE